MHLYVFIIIFTIAFISLIIGFIVRGIYLKLIFSVISAVLFFALAVLAHDITVTESVVAQTVVNTTTNATVYNYTTIAQNVSTDYLNYIMLMLAIPPMLNVYNQLPELAGEVE